MLAASCLLTLPVFSQKYQYDDSTHLAFLNKEWCEVDKKEDAAYVRLITGVNKERPVYIFRDFFVTGEPQMVGGSTSREFLREEGEFVWYFKETKKLSRKGSYSKGQPTGTWYDFYRNGELQTEYIVLSEADKTEQKLDTRIYSRRIINSWDSTGKKEVSDGNGLFIQRDKDYKTTGKVTIKNGFPDGIWEIYDASGQKTEEQQYRDGIFIKGQHVGNGTAYTYDTLSVRPEYPGGEMALNRFLARNIRYPRIAQEKGMQGTVILKFIVGTDGRISNITVCTSAGTPLDNEASRVVSLMPVWKPGMRLGLVHAEEMNLPVRFTLRY